MDGAGEVITLSGSAAPSSSADPAHRRTFELYLAKEDFKFSAAHFVAHDGGRERLHGHNYQVSVWLRGVVGDDGYVVDFGELKKVIRALCKEHNERFLCPLYSKSVKVITCPTSASTVLSGSSTAAASDGAATSSGSSSSGSSGELLQVELTAADGSRFSLPASDVLLLPVSNTTVEELALLLAERLVKELGPHRLADRGVRSITVGVAETPRQEARYTVAIA